MFEFGNSDARVGVDFNAFLLHRRNGKSPAIASSVVSAHHASACELWSRNQGQRCGIPIALYDVDTSGGVYCAKEPVALDNDPSQPRIYDMIGNLVADASTYILEADPTSPMTLQQWNNNGGFHRFTDIEMARKFGLGYEGPAGSVDRGRKVVLRSRRISI